MVDGVSGVGNGMSAEDIKAYVQELVEETLAAKSAETVDSSVTTDSVDEESEVVTEETTTTTAAQSEEVTNPLTGLLTSITSLFGQMMNVMMQMFGMSTSGVQQTTSSGSDATQSEHLGDTKYTMTEDEKAYLTLHPDYVKDLIAEEKYQEKYGDDSFLKSYRMRRIESKITDEEIQAYLQLHPNVIKDAIANS